VILPSGGHRVRRPAHHRRGHVDGRLANGRRRLGESGRDPSTTP